MTRLTLRSLAARPLRTALTTLAIVLGVALIAGSLTLTDTQRRASESLSSSAYDGTAAAVTAKTAFDVESTDWTVSNPTVPASKLEQVRSTPGVGVAVGDVTDLNAKIIGKDGKPLGDGPYFGVGLDSRTPGAVELSPFNLVDGRWAAGPGEVVVDQKTAEDEGYGVGRTVTVTGRGEAQRFEVVGVARFGEVRAIGPATVAVFDLPTAQRLFHKGDAYDAILVGAADGVDGAAVRASLRDRLGDTARVRTAAEQDRFTFDGLDQFISVIRIVLLVFGGVAILVGALTIVNSLSITLAQRTREIGMLRLVGASRRQILRGVLGEALAVGLAGSLLGLGAGYLLAMGLQSLFVSLGLDLPDAGTVFATSTIVISLVVGTLVTVLAGLVPALRATRITPVAALRDGDAGARRVGIAGRAIRPVVSLLGIPAARLGGAAGILARRNAMRSPGRTLSTAGALTVGVALVTVVAIVAAGLRDTTRASVEDRVHGAYVVTGQDGWSPTDPELARTLRGVDGVRDVTTVRQDGALVLGDKERVNAIDGPGVTFDYAQGSAAATELGRDGAIVDEAWAKESGLTVGERFAMTSATGERLNLVVRAIETSPVISGVDLGPITIDRAVFDGAFRSELSTLTVVDAPGVGEAALEKAIAGHPDAQLLTKDGYIDDVMTDIDTLMALFVVLLALAVIVSLFGIVNALVLATFERRRELGMLAAVGMTRRQIRRMVRHESIVTALLGAVTGVAAGLGLGKLVTAALSDEGLSFVVPTGSLVALAVVAVVAGVLAAVLPARRAARMSPLSALAYE
jgi:putative ABC transport system permease protein